MCFATGTNIVLRPSRRMGGPPWFETPRTRLRNLANPKLAAPHHEAVRGCGCIKLSGICSKWADRGPAVQGTPRRR
jgi:hypothetical protein